ncbi:MAG TPA: undecaprenyl-diphosphate phosphatase [Nitrososphaerales archaeon]|nr:undecaprenyl-diphosphate phosphatase [Nitrososphaerales archaeon]
MNVLASIVVGFVQGVSEWLPISSKTQVLIVSSYLFALPAAAAFAFGLFMELGSVGSATIYFRRDILSLLRDRKLLVYLVVVTVVTGIVGTPLYVISDRLLQNSYNVGVPMMILGVVLVFDGLFIRYSRRVASRTLTDMRLKHYVLVGVAQGLAALPGVSRSGMTVSTMLLLGVEPKSAFRLSYLAYIPASLGGVLVTAIFSKSELRIGLDAVTIPGVLLAIVVACLVGLAVIAVLLRFARKNTIYVITLSLGVLALVVGLLSALGVA